MLCEERSPFLCLTACFLFCIKFWSSIYFLRFHLNSSKMFSQARVQFLLSCTVTAPRFRRHTFVEEGVMVLSFWRRALIFLLAPSPESGWGHVQPRWKPLSLVLCGVLVDSFASIHGGSPWALPGAVFVLYLVHRRLPVHTDCGSDANKGKGRKGQR